MATNNREPVRIAAFGEFLLRLHCSENKRILQAGAYNAYFAGAEANVCVLLARLGVPASFINRAPETDITLAGIGQ